jgi:hypothetical protein
MNYRSQFIGALKKQLTRDPRNLALEQEMTAIVKSYGDPSKIPLGFETFEQLVRAKLGP